MNVFGNHCQIHVWLLAAVLSVSTAGCSRDGIFGASGVAAPIPIVTAVTPLDGAVDVIPTNTVINATFSERMAPLTGTASMTVTCASPCVNPTGTVSLDTTNTIATFAVTSGTVLAVSTLYTGTITGAMSLRGVPIAASFTWAFTTGATADLTRPRVTLTVPATTVPGPTQSAPANAAIIGVFSKALDPTTVTGTSFTVTCAAPCVSPAGTVDYSVTSRTATFHPAANLVEGSIYTATLTIAIRILRAMRSPVITRRSPLPVNMYGRS